MALLHANDRVERIGAQCNNIATLSEAMPEGGRPSADQLGAVDIGRQMVFAETGRLRLAGPQ
jgi:hypothetical protein